MFCISVGAVPACVGLGGMISNASKEQTNQKIAEIQVWVIFRCTVFLPQKYDTQFGTPNIYIFTSFSVYRDFLHFYQQNIGTPIILGKHVQRKVCCIICSSKQPGRINQPNQPFLLFCSVTQTMRGCCGAGVQASPKCTIVCPRSAE